MADRFRRARPGIVFLGFQAGTASVGLTALIVWPILGRYLSAAQIGVMSGWLAASSIVSPALAFGLHLTLANRLSSDPRATTRAEGRLALTWPWSLTVIALVFFLLNRGGTPWLDVAALSCASASSLVVSGTARGLNRPLVFAVYTLFVQIGGLLGIGFGAWFISLHFGVLIYIVVSAFGLIAQSLLLGVRPLLGTWVGSSQVLRRSLALVPHLILAVALLMMMRLIVGFEAGSSSLGRFQYASLLIGGSVTLAASLDAHWSIRAQAETDEAKLISRLRRQQTRLQVMVLGVTVLVVVFCFVGLGMWLPAGYPSADIRMAVFLAIPAASLQAFADGKAALAMWRNNYGLVSTSTFISVVVALLLGVGIVHIWGWPLVGLSVTFGALVRAFVISLFVRSSSTSAGFGAANLALVATQFVLGAAAVAIISIVLT